MNSVNPETNKRPVVATVFGIILIIQGALMLCCCFPLGVVGMLLPDLASDYPQNYMPFLYGTILISAGEIVYGLVAAICLLLNKSWARVHTMIWAGLSVVTSLIYLTVDYGYFGVKWRLEAEDGIFGVVFELIIYVGSFILYGLTLFFMSRPNVKEYYGR